jgi:CO/xanthine dehydrogenase Mo-binding subunit
MSNTTLLERLNGDTSVKDGLLLAGFVNPADLAYDEPVDKIDFNFGFSRRSFVQLLGAGLMFAVCEVPASAQDAGKKGGKGGRGGGGFGAGPTPKLAARLHLGKDGTVTVFTGKVECGQGSRTEISQAAAEELRLPFDKIALVMSDTALTPDDGMTAGSGTTPRTLPAIRQAAATAFQVLTDLAAKAWTVDASEIEARDGKLVHKASNHEQTYGEIVASEEAASAFSEQMPTRVNLTRKSNWKVMGVPTPRPNRRELVTGEHRYPSDIIRPGMMYGKVLRPAFFGFGSKPAKLKVESLDTSAAKAMDGVTVVQDGDFVGVVAPTSYQAKAAIEAIKAEWEHPPHVDSKGMFAHLEQKARGGVPANPNAETVGSATKSLKADYHVAYAQHAPMEPRAQVAEWDGDKVTVWTASQGPFRVRGDLANAFRIPQENVHVIIPDFGGGFGGKHSGESGVEAARLAKAVGKPVHLLWTRAEEFTWAYFRPADLVKAEASLDDAGKISSWYYVSINADQSELRTPYKVGKPFEQSVATESPLRHGSYRGLGSTGHNFARESFMDELAHAAGQDPLEFRLAHLENDRIRAVLEEAAKQFGWNDHKKQKRENFGVGLACGTDKGSVVACCVAVEVDPKADEIRVLKVCEVYECGAIINPENLRTQTEGAILMGLGPALREEVKFENGQMTSAAFSKYLVPRFDDVPELDIHLLDRPLPDANNPSAGAGETPIIVIAPAIANAVFNASGKRIRQMPIKLSAAT